MSEYSKVQKILQDEINRYIQSNKTHMGKGNGVSNIKA